VLTCPSFSASSSHEGDIARHEPQTRWSSRGWWRWWSTSSYISPSNASFLQYLESDTVIMTHDLTLVSSFWMEIVMGKQNPTSRGISESKTRFL
jgi:hypothetical protein